MRRALESVYQIISSLSHSSGQGYFDTFVSEIANAVGADFVLISGKDQAGLFFTVHAAYPASLDINSYSFPLADTPGEIAPGSCSPMQPCWSAARSGVMPALH